MPKRDRRSEPKALALAKLRESALTERDAKRLGITWTRSAAALHPSFSPRPALRLPYFELNGRLNCFYRVRYLDSATGFEAQSERPRRYAQEPGTGVAAYLPPLLDRPWSEVARDTATPLVITEGELKAACACRRGLPTVGLGGVDSWRSRRAGVDLLPELAAFDWSGREVYVTYDSDAVRNPQVRRAELALCRELAGRGARPMIARLPELAGLSKTGLDDFLVARGDAALATVLRAAEPDTSAAALHHLNEEVLFVRDPGLVLVRETGQKIAPDKFKSATHANRTHVEQVPMPNGGTRPQTVSTAAAWLKWAGRAEVERLVYSPGEPATTSENEHNLWRGWGVEPRRGDVRPWSELLDYMFQELSDERAWFERWCAWPLRHPGTKLYTSVLLWGAAQGTGKSLVAYSLGRIYGDNFAEISDADLRSSFNDWAEGKQLVLGEEITGTDKRAEADRIKGLITRQLARINTKFVPTYTVADRINYIFTSNHPDALFMEDTDRRLFVHEAPNMPLPDAFYRRYDAWYRSTEGAGALFHHLLGLNLGDFSPSARAPLTAAKAAMIRDAKSDLGAWVHHLREDPAAALLPLRASRTPELLTTTQLLRCYDPEGSGRVTANGLARELKRAGLRQARDGSPVKTSSGTQRLWVLCSDGRRWSKASPARLAREWDELFGPKAKKY